MNVYSTGVKCGNWVEDRIGDEMTRTEPAYQPPVMTEARSTLLRPGDMNDRAGAEVPQSTKTELMMGRPGVSYSMMFNHGPDNAVERPEDRFATMNSMLLSGNKDMNSDTLLKTKKKNVKEMAIAAPPSQTSAKLREKLKAESRAKRDGQFNTTNGKALNKRTIPVERKARMRTDVSK